MGCAADLAVRNTLLTLFKTSPDSILSKIYFQQNILLLVKEYAYFFLSPLFASCRTLTFHTTCVLLVLTCCTQAQLQLMSASTGQLKNHPLPHKSYKSYKSVYEPYKKEGDAFITVPNITFVQIL